MFMYILGGLLLGIFLGIVLGRWAVRLGALFLMVGVGPFFGLYVYETYFYTAGDTSAMGMLSTLLLILFAPFGLALMVIGWLRGD